MTGRVEQAEEDHAIRLFVTDKITEEQLDHQRRFIGERLERPGARLDEHRARASAQGDRLGAVEQVVEQWFEDQRWPDGERFCPDCGSERYSIAKNRKPMPYRCKDCRQYFSVRKGTVMQSSKLGLQKWAIAIYMMATNLKGVSSMRIHRDLGIDQRAAWHMMQRIREAFLAGDGLKMPGPVEVDETFMGGRDRNKHASKRQGRQGTRGKTPVIGARTAPQTR